MNSNIKAFTLVELAIVIVIIGLLVGGVLQGQELIKQARIRSFIKLGEQMSTANNTFIAKYNAMAGDMVNATNFFDTTACEDLTYSTVPCNSDQGNGGNNLLDGAWGGSASDAMRYFVHMNLSKILKVTPSTWTGSTDYSYYEMQGFQNRQWAVAMSGSVLNTRNMRPGATAAQQPLTNQNYFFFFTYSGPYGTGTWDASLATADDAAGVDSKIDDGKPLTGKFMAGTGYGNSLTECVLGTEYNYANSDVSCNLFLNF